MQQIARFFELCGVLTHRSFWAIMESGPDDRM
jgi:hypothetical protein